MSSESKYALITGAAILTLAGLICRVTGFFYRIFLSHSIGAEGMGIYQMIFPVYGFCFALVVSGMQTAISRSCAASWAAGRPRQAKTSFLAGFSLSLGLSLVIAFLLHGQAGRLAKLLSMDSRCIPLLQLIAFGIPFGVVHTCISAYYYARNKTAVPAAAQLLEQFTRVGASLVIWQIFLAEGKSPSPALAVGGLLAGELASSLFSGICILVHFQNPSLRRGPSGSFWRSQRELTVLALPLAANRVLLTLLQSGEAILIPGHLVLSGMTSDDALTLFGVFSGMAMPFILFPSAITGSVSTLLLPTVAAAEARGNEEGIRRATEKTIQYCLLLGILAAGVFFFYGNALGRTVFHSAQAGTFIRILSFVCPFLYLTGTLSSILNGLGHTTLCFWQNAAGLLIRIGFVVLAVPGFGIQGYLWGILASQLAVTALNLIFLRKQFVFSVSAWDWIVKPAAALAVCMGISLLFQSLLGRLALPGLAVLAASLLAAGLIYLGLLRMMGLLPDCRRPDGAGGNNG